MYIFTILKVYCDEVQGPIVSVMGTNYTCTGGKEVSNNFVISFGLVKFTVLQPTLTDC